MTATWRSAFSTPQAALLDRGLRGAAAVVVVATRGGQAVGAIDRMLKRLVRYKKSGRLSGRGVRGGIKGWLASLWSRWHASCLARCIGRRGNSKYNVVRRGP